jgi:signal transduction histidine kinase
MTGDEFAPLFGSSGFELRFDLAGRAAVRVAGGPVAPRHVEPAPPAAPWVLEARRGAAAAWLLAPAAPEDPERARALLQRMVECEAALALPRLARQAAAMGAELLERLTHQLRTDVTALQAVAEGALNGLFEPDELATLPAELEQTGREAQRRLSGVREVMTALEPAARRAPEPVVETLRRELEAAGREEVVVAGPAAEQPLGLVPGAGWAACARLLAGDDRLWAFAVEPDPGGWRVAAGPRGTPVEWTERTVGGLVHAGHIVAAAGGSAAAEHDAEGRLRVVLTLPAAPPSG